jgi:predicted DNA-binding transcriptional regulator AlpA
MSLRSTVPEVKTSEEISPPSDQLLRKSQVAELLGVGKRAVERLVAAGKFPPPVNLAANMPRWPVEEVVKHLESLKAARKQAAEPGL